MCVCIIYTVYIFQGMKMGHCDAANLDPLHGEKGRMLTLKTLLADKKVYQICLIIIYAYSHVIVLFHNLYTFCIL